MSSISRQRMEETIRGGGSVMVGSRIIDNIRDLPSEVELAKGDKTATQSVRESLLAKRAETERQIAELDAAGTPTGEDSTGEPTVIDLETLTVAQLKEVAEERQIPLTADMKKADIVDAIRAAAPTK